MVGATGFEPATSASRTPRSAKLSHAPKMVLFFISMMIKIYRIRLTLSNIVDILNGLITKTFINLFFGTL